MIIFGQNGACIDDSVVALADLALGFPSGYHLAALCGTAACNRHVIGYHAGHLQVIADRLLLRAIVDARIRLIHLDDARLFTGGLVDGLLLVDLVEQLAAHIHCMCIHMGTMARAGLLHWLALAIEFLLLGNIRGWNLIG